jgi:antirestriction protein ArdC
MSTNENTATPTPNVYERVTSAIVNAIEAGAGTYQMPWVIRQDKGFSPVSVGSAKPYRGINVVVLWSQAQSKGYNSSLWGTYRQWAELGAQVRKGEHGSPVVYWGTLERDQTEPSGDADSTSSGRTRLFAKGYTVFNTDQVDGLKMPKRFQPKLGHNQRVDRAQSFFGPLAQVRDGGNQAYYRPDKPEAVYMPAFDQFPEAQAYYSVLAHETTHWTSHESRCNRELGKRFGDQAYAVEELIAELGAAFTMAHLELETTPRIDHAQYIATWLRVLKADARAIFTAASKAQQAADYLIARAGVSARFQEVAA